jgi:hypothetical protein
LPEKVIFDLAAVGSYGLSNGTMAESSDWDSEIAK